MLSSNCDDLLVLGSLHKHLTAGHYRQPLTSGNIGIVQDVCFKFQIIEPALNHIANADDASQLAIAKHRHVTHAMTGHQVH